MRVAAVSASSATGSSSAFSFTTMPEILTSTSANGNSNVVIDRLKIVWKMEICTALILEAAKAGRRLKKINPIDPNTIAPMTLKVRCMTAARLAVRDPPILESMAVTQEPIFWPSVI